jgi:TonB family protein
VDIGSFSNLQQRKDPLIKASQPHIGYGLLLSLLLHLFVFWPTLLKFVSVSPKGKSIEPQSLGMILVDRDPQKVSKSSKSKSSGSQNGPGSEVQFTPRSLRTPRNDDSIVGASDNSLNSLSSYLRDIQIQIEAQKRFPTAAQFERQFGVVWIEFEVHENGSVQNIKINQSSGFAILDEEALETLRRVGSAEPPPNGHKLTIKVPLEFKLE